MTRVSVDPTARRSLSSPQRLCLTGSLAWSIVLIALVTWVPFYGTAESSASEQVGKGPSRTIAATVKHGSATLAAVNGPVVYAVALLPMVATVVVAVALWVRRDKTWAGAVAWGVTGASCVVDLLAMLTIGPLLLPTTGALVVACALHGSTAGSPPRSAPGASPAG